MWKKKKPLVYFLHTSFYSRNQKITSTHINICTNVYSYPPHQKKDKQDTIDGYNGAFCKKKLLE